MHDDHSSARSLDLSHHAAYDGPRESRMARSTIDPLRQTRVRIERWHEHARNATHDELVAEEPLEIRVQAPGAGDDEGPFETLAVVLRTPGHDEELAAGFLFTEGFLFRREELHEIRPGVDGDGLPSDNVREVLPAPGVDLAGRIAAEGYTRRFAVNSSCGVCGKNSVAAACATFPRLATPRDGRPDNRLDNRPDNRPDNRLDNRLDDDDHGFVVAPGVLYGLPERIRAEQRVFEATGGLHAAAIFDGAGGLRALREDIGRHNAVDKLVGRALLDGALPLANRILLVSGRLSFEIVLKALAARIPVVAAVSAPSSLAVELADASGITLAAFVRGAAMNVYTHGWRVRA